MQIKVYILERLDKVYLAPLVPWAVFFCLGIIFEARSNISFFALFYAALAAFALCALLLKKRIWSHFLLYSCAFLSGCLIFANSQAMPLKSEQVVRIGGIVVSDPHNTARRSSFILSSRCYGKVSVRCYKKSDFAYGDELVLEGRFHKPFFNVKKDGFVKHVAERKGNKLRHFSIGLRHRMEKIIAANVDPFSAVILNAILLGEQGKEMRPVRDMMVKAGTWHIMVVSGSHTALLAFIFLMFFKVLRMPRVPRFLLAMVLLLAYCFLTGATSPVVRATIMAIVFLFSFLIERNPVCYNAMCLAAVLILAIDPASLFNIGFQLSFVSVFFIVWLFPKMKRLFPWKGVLSRLADYFFVSLTAWIGTAPLLAASFGTFSLVTVFANMVIVPLAMLVVTAGFVLLAIGSLNVCFVHWAAESVEFLVFCLLWVNSFFSRIPFSFYEFQTIPYPAILCLYCALFFLFSFCLKSRQ